MKRKKKVNILRKSCAILRTSMRMLTIPEDKSPVFGKAFA